MVWSCFYLTFYVKLNVLYFGTIAKVQETPKQKLLQQQEEHNGELDEEILIVNRMKLAQKMAGQKKKADKQ